MSNGMTGEQFRAILREELESLIAMNENKGRDYAGEDNALAYFLDCGRELNMAPEQVLLVLARKHWRAVVTFCANVGDDGYQPSEEIRGRILDLILYLFLLLALDRRETGPKDAQEPPEPKPGPSAPPDHSRPRRHE